MPGSSIKDGDGDGKYTAGPGGDVTPVNQTAEADTGSSGDIQGKIDALRSRPAPTTLAEAEAFRDECQAVLSEAKGGGSQSFGNDDVTKADAFGRTIGPAQIPDDTASLLADYQEGDYALYNEHLRSGEVNAKLDGRIAKIDAAMASSTLPESTRVYRGAELTGDQVNQLKSLAAGGGRFKDAAYSSTSLVPEVGEINAFKGTGGQSCLFEIEVPAGSNAIYVNRYTGVGPKSSTFKEMELLLPRGSRFAVKSHAIRKVNGKDVNVFSMAVE